MLRKALTLCLLIVGSTVSPVLAGRAMTPEDLYTIKRVGDPRVSPDGAWVVLTVGVPDLAANTIHTDLWLVPMSGGEARQLTTATGNDHSPRWSPDGGRLAFISDRNGTANLFLLSLDGGEARQLTNSETALSQPVWAGNGRYLVCRSRVLPVNKQSRENWTEDELPECRARTIDRLLFRQWDRWLGDERNHLFLVDVEDGGLTELTTGDYDTPPVSLASSHDFDISPDGAEICLVRNDDPDSALSTNHDLWLIDRSTSQLRKLTNNPALDSSPHYSPDGRYISYRAMSRPGYESDRQVLMVYNRASGEHRALTSSLDRSVGDMVWAPDAGALFFSARDQGRSNIFRVDLDGKVTRVVEGGYSDRVRVTPDGKRLVFVRSFNHQPAEIFSYSPATGESTQLTSFNTAMADEIALPELEDFWFSGAEGTRVHGFIQKPPGFDPAHKYPVVLVIHGGPQGMWGDRFMTTWFTFTLASSPGYVAVMINPRGSSGYGLEFRAQVSRDYGGRCMQDLLLGLDHAIAAYPYIDAERQAAIGGSFGGYSVNWLIGHSDRFKCAVSHAGLYNLTSFYGATEELWYPAWDKGKSPWQEPELYAKWSPHRAAASFSTPTLVTHGELDYRVPFAESLQLFTALQVQGIPSRLVVFPDDGHVIEQPQNNVRWWKEIHRWLAEHL